MKIDDLPKRYLNNLNLKLFVSNQRHDILSSLWCLCDNHLLPPFVNNSTQHMTLKLNNDNMKFTFTVMPLLVI